MKRESSSDSQREINVKVDAKTEEKYSWSLDHLVISEFKIMKRNFLSNLQRKLTVKDDGKI